MEVEMGKIKVTIWNEFVHEQDAGAIGDYIRKIYPDGIHNFLKEKLQSDDLEIRAVSLDMPEQGLPDEVLNDTDVLMWWGHCAHHLVDDALVERLILEVFLEKVYKLVEFFVCRDDIGSESEPMDAVQYPTYSHIEFFHPQS